MVWLVFGATHDGDPELCTASREAVADGRAPRYSGAVQAGAAHGGVDALGGAFIVSAVHSDAQIDHTVAAAEDALRKMKADEVLR